jgi:hypothetical protein
LRRRLIGIKGEQLTPSSRPARRARAAATPATWRPRALPAYGSLDSVVVDRGPPWGLRLAFPPCTTPRPRLHRTWATRPCADAHVPAGAHAGPAVHATPSALGCPPTSSMSFRRRSAKNREFTSSPWTLCTAAVLHCHYRHLASPHSIPVAQPLLSLP